MLFTPRPKILEKAASLMAQMLRKNRCTPAEASKLRDIMGFLFNGAFGKLGRGGQQVLLQRQYSDRRSPCLVDLQRNHLLCEARGGLRRQGCGCTAP